MPEGVSPPTETEPHEALTDQATKVHDGDMGHAETMLISQAHALDAIFARLAVRALVNIEGGAGDRRHLPAPGASGAVTVARNAGGARGHQEPAAPGEVREAAERRERAAAGGEQQRDGRTGRGSRERKGRRSANQTFGASTA
jgi:hypothetical protein